MHEAPCVCPTCGATKFGRIGFDERMVLEYVPSHFKRVLHVRPKMSCRACETVVQAPMPTLPIEKGRPGPALLAHVLVSNMIAIISRCIARLTFTGAAGWRSTALSWRAGSVIWRRSWSPWPSGSRGHVRAGASRLHADDTPVPVLDPWPRANKDWPTMGGGERREPLWIDVALASGFLSLLSRSQGRARPCVAQAAVAAISMPRSTRGFARFYEADPLKRDLVRAEDISCVGEVVGALGRSTVEQGADGSPGRFDCSSIGLAQQGLHFGEGLLDRIEVWRVGGQEEELGLAARMAARMARPLWLPRLSITTMSSGARIGDEDLARR